MDAIKKKYPIRDENNQPSTYPTFASQVFFDDGTALEGKQFGGGGVNLLEVYPVGSVYISASETSPASLFGGTWEQIKGRFLIGTGAPENNDDGTTPGSYNYPAGSTGGEEKHMLTIAEMPEHRHDGIVVTGIGMVWEGVFAAGNDKYGVNTGESGSPGEFGTIFEGGDRPHNNMPPYLAVYMWKRVS